MSSSISLLALTMPGLPEWIMIAAVGLLFFGKRLPEVGRSLGKGIVEFKKGLAGIDDDVRTGLEDKTPARPALQQGEAKFDPYTGKPIKAESASQNNG
jgi:sec-independent protein translocase protein TatA